MNQTNVKRYGLTVTILFISMLQMGGMGLSPSLASISAEMPEVPVSVVQTLTSFPSLVMIFVCLLANKLVFKLGKKVILLTGAACISVVGRLGYLFNSSIVLLYVWAALLGVGFGTVLPTTSGVLAENYEGRGRSILMGAQSVFTNIGAMYLTYVGGWMAAIHWHLNYLVYLYALIPVILGIIFIPNDKPAIAASTAGQEERVSVRSLSRNTWVYGAITFLFMILYGVHSANVSFFVEEKSLGSPAVVGTIMAVSTIGGMVGGATFGFVNRLFKTYTFCAAFILMAISLFITISADSLTPVMIGALVIGCSISWDIPQSMLSITNENSVEAAAMACSVAHIGGQIGNFASSLVMTNITSLFGSTVTFRYSFTAVACVVMAVITFVLLKVIKADK